MSDGLYALALTEAERLIIQTALDARSHSLEAVAMLAPGGSQAEKAAFHAISETTLLAGKVAEAVDDGIACDRCGRAVTPQTGTPHYCSEVCWRQHINERTRAVD